MYKLNPPSHCYLQTENPNLEANIFPSLLLRESILLTHLSCLFNRVEIERYFHIHTIHVWYIYLHLVDFYGKCSWIQHTWMVWDMNYGWYLYIPPFFMWVSTWSFLGCSMVFFRQYDLGSGPKYWWTPPAKCFAVANPREVVEPPIRIVLMEEFLHHNG